MKIYFAPLESITNYRYRKHYDAHFRGVDRYYIPFLSPKDYSLTNRDRNEIKKENNLLNKEVVPQIISNDAEETLWLINELKDLGFKEVNLNFGCPSGTVVSKGRGSGMLKDLGKMRTYLSKIFAKSPLPISIKTRIGYQSEDEFSSILEVYNEFPIKELIIHPRTTKEMYKGSLHLNIFDGLDKKTSIPVVYNGEIKNKNDIEFISARYPWINAVMIGRGFLEYPDMLEASSKDNIKDFILSLSNEYIKDIGWGNASYPIKEMWSYLIHRFDIDTSLKKKLFKEKNKDTFFQYVDEVFETSSLKTSFSNGIMM